MPTIAKQVSRDAAFKVSASIGADILRRIDTQ
jgi:hypothetical protein